MGGVEEEAVEAPGNHFVFFFYFSGIILQPDCSNSKPPKGGVTVKEEKMRPVFKILKAIAICIAGALGAWSGYVFAIQNELTSPVPFSIVGLLIGAFIIIAILKKD